MELYSKEYVIEYIWIYSRFYGNNLSDCESQYRVGNGYTALILLFATVENICKSIIGNYDENFINVVSNLKVGGIITEEEEKFLSKNEISLRKIRNMFAHCNLIQLNIVENGIYYPLTEKDSCLFLYEKISDITYNILLNIISSRFNVELRISLDNILSQFEINIKELSSEEYLSLIGFNSNDINRLKQINNDNDLLRLADNSSNIAIYEAIFKELFLAEEIPKEVRVPSDKISLSVRNEMLYDGKLYTGKIVFDDVSYMNLKDGHLEGKTFIGDDEREISFNIVNGKLKGDYKSKGLVFGIYNDVLINFENGKIKNFISSIASKGYNFTFDSSGNGNGTFNNSKIGTSLNFKDGVAETNDGFTLKINIGGEGDNILESKFGKKDGLISEDFILKHINRSVLGKIMFKRIFGELSDKERNEHLENEK